MKRTFIFISLLLSFSAFRLADDLSKYGINIPEFKQMIQTLALYKNFPTFTYYLPQNIRDLGKKLSEAERAVMAKAVGTFVKTYVSSAQFKTDLNKTLDAQKEIYNPQSAEWKEAYNNEYITQLGDIESVEKIGLYNDEFFATQQGVVNTYKKLLDETTETNTEMLAVFKQSIEVSSAIVALKPLVKTDKVAFMKKLATIQTNNLFNQKAADIKTRNNDLDQQKDFSPNIKTQLQEFLDETADVDYNAATKTVGSHIEFVNPEYQHKSRIWRQSFRIGKSGMTVFRGIAEEWLKEL